MQRRAQAQAQVADRYSPESLDAPRLRFEFSLPGALAALIVAALLSLPSTADSVASGQAPLGWFAALIASVG
jgi:hypothetical protein